MFRGFRFPARVVPLGILELVALPVFGKTGEGGVGRDPRKRRARPRSWGEQISKGKAQPSSCAGCKLPVPRLKDILVLADPGKAELDGKGIPRPEEGGVPREPGANTATVGHPPGFPETKLPYAFYELD